MALNNTRLNVDTIAAEVEDDENLEVALEVCPNSASASFFLASFSLRRRASSSALRTSALYVSRHLKKRTNDKNVTRLIISASPIGAVLPLLVCAGDSLVGASRRISAAPPPRQVFGGDVVGHMIQTLFA